MSEKVSVVVGVPGIAVGWVAAEGCVVAESSEVLTAELRSVTSRAVADRESAASVGRKSAARDMLRHGSYKPTGRGKPASEYLLNAATEEHFPSINNIVDINNLVSVECLLPISLVDIDLAGSRSFLIRRGREGEEYVFNQSGQVLSLKDLLLAARMPADGPCATPIKDCQATKTHPGTRTVLALIYAPAALALPARQAAERMAALLGAHAGATATSGVVRSVEDA